MAVVNRFSAVHYNPKKFSKIGDLVSPPFDMVRDDLRKKLREEINNYIHLILPEGEGESKYKNAVNKLFGWLLRDVLVVDRVPTFYIHEQNFILDGNSCKRYGVIGLLKLEEYGNSVGKHEMSFEKRVEDRYFLMKEAQSNLEPIFCLYRDKEAEMAKKIKTFLTDAHPFLDVPDLDGNRNRVFKIEDPDFNQWISAFFKDRKIDIADGHHRYEAALRYKDEMQMAPGKNFSGKEPFNFIMADFFSANDETLVILAFNLLIRQVSLGYNELLKKLNDLFKIAAIVFEDEKSEQLARKKLQMVLKENKEKGIRAYGMFLKTVPNRYFVLNLKEAMPSDSADLETLEREVLEKLFGIQSQDYKNGVTYEGDFSLALNAVRSGNFDAAFLINPVSIKEVLELSDKNKLMPNKATNFYPKVLSGLTLFSYRYSSIEF
jgi:uncharacterized protein (DUF1015 family)